MNPSRGLSAAYLCALLGASAAAHPGPDPVASPEAIPEAGSGFAIPNGPCAGRGGKAAAPILTGHAFDLRAHRLAPAAAARWKLAGYAANAESSRLLSPAGRPIPDAEYERLSAPFDAAVDRMTNRSWSTLIFSGYRLQDSTCRLLDPEKRQPLTRLDVLAFEKQVSAFGGNSATEELLARLKGQDPSKPPSAAVLARMAELEARGEKLPDKLRLALFSHSLTAGALRGRAEGDYAAMLRSWEGARETKSLAEDALPPVEGFNVPGLKRGRYESWEQVIGDGFSADIQKLFSRTEAGRELLSRFKDARGRPDVPKMTVLKLAQRPDDPGYGAALAVYDSGTRTIVLNHWYVVGQIMAGVAPGERAKLGAQLSDSRALAEYLRTHPAAMAAVSDRMDVTVFHELTHAWQYRRQSLAVESIRGNASSGIVLAHEHEAFFGMYRYLHEKMMADPNAALRTDQFGGYLQALSDPEKFRDQITSNYQKTIAGSTDFRTLLQIQAEKTSILGFPVAFSAKAATRALLERLRLARGAAALTEARDDQAATERLYLRKFYPQMQLEAARTLPDALARAGRPDLSFKVLAAVPSSARAGADRRPEFAAATAEMLARRSSVMSLEDRLEAFSALNAEMRREKKSLPRGALLQYDRDAVVVAGQYADQAQDASEQRQRDELIKTAHAWLASVPVNAPGAPALRRRLAVLEKAR